MDLAPLLPQEALAPFAEEISGRQKRRERRAEQEAKTAQREAAAVADAAAAAASRGLTAQELKVTHNPLLNAQVCIQSQTLDSCFPRFWYPNKMPVKLTCAAVMVVKC